MSVQFGKWNFDGHALSAEYANKICTMLAPYGPDSCEEYCQGGVKILYRAFCTTKESWCEKQPHISSSGVAITWDGRLDNRNELLTELNGSISTDSTDVAIVAAAYEKWDNDCFKKLIGDWAIAIWNPRNRWVLLAKDHIGTRHLYYSINRDNITWSTALEPLVLLAGKTLAVCEEYIAGWFSYRFPPAHLTPYSDIYSVPPSSFVLLTPRHHTIGKYWELDPSKKTRYRTDAEYEEHFRSVFAQAIRRRLRSDRPVLAELSGGMDSSSIVCMADLIAARGQAECQCVDTISWYDDSYDHLEPDTNELHWVYRVEEKRGRAGYHLNLRDLKSDHAASAQRSFESQFETSRLAVTPLHNGALPAQFQAYAAHMKAQGYRVVLSGLGGDDSTGGGGVPSPTAELQDLLVRARFGAAARQLNAWAVKMRKHRLPLAWEAVREFFPLSLGGGEARDRCPASWLHPDFARRNWAALRGYPSRIAIFGPAPSFQHNLAKLNMERRLQSCAPMLPDFPRDVRFPFHDRDFLEFVYTAPPEQIVRVGQRRSLMKRALAGIVPNELLTRKRKPFAPPQEPANTTQSEWPSSAELGQHILGGSVGIIDASLFLEEVRKARGGERAAVDDLDLGRTIRLEAWLRHLVAQRVLTSPVPGERSPSHHSSASGRSQGGGALTCVVKRPKNPLSSRV